jgi:hypothetical protein
VLDRKSLTSSQKQPLLVLALRVACFLEEARTSTMALRVALGRPLFQSPTAAAIEAAPLRCSWRKSSQVPVNSQAWSSLPDARQDFCYKVTNRIGTLHKCPSGRLLARMERRPAFRKCNSFTGNWTKLGIPPARKAFRTRGNARTGNIRAGLSDILHNEVRICLASSLGISSKAFDVNVPSMKYLHKKCSSSSHVKWAKFCLS